MTNSRPLGLAAAALVLLLIGAGPAFALTEAEVSARFAAEYDVRVLKTERWTLHDRKVYRLTVMNKGGNFNEAFQVYTVAVDPDTGKLISDFENRGGAPGATRYDPNRQPAESMRPGVPVWR